MNHRWRLLVIALVFVASLGAWWVYHQREEKTAQVVDGRVGTYIAKGVEDGTSLPYVAVIALHPIQEGSLPRNLLIMKSAYYHGAKGTDGEMIPADDVILEMDGPIVYGVVQNGPQTIDKSPIGKWDNDTLIIRAFRFQKVSDTPEGIDALKKRAYREAHQEK